MKHSRHLGSLSFCEEDDESVVDAAVMLAGTPVPAMLVIRDPAAFDQDALERLDDEIDRLAALEAGARAKISEDIADPDSVVGEYWAFFRDDIPEWNGRSAADFLAALAVVRVGVFPDGAWGTTSVFTVDYGIREPDTDQLLAVRFPDARTPVVAWES